MYLSFDADIIEDIYYNNNDISIIYEFSCNEEENINEKDRYKFKFIIDIFKLFEDFYISEVKDGILFVDIFINLEKRKYSYV